MFEAARFGDEIAHTSALGGFLIGAALGIALIATVAIATFTCGFGVALLAGLAAGVGGSLLTSLGESIGSSFSSPSGTIVLASANVFINSRKAAHVEKSIGACDKHSGPVQVAEGSTNVFINGTAAARKGDKITCGAKISSGSDNVFIGGGTHRYLPVDDEIPGWLRTTVDILMAVAGAAGGIAQLIKAGTQAGMKAVMPCVLKFTAGFVAGEVASRYVVGPAIERAVGGLVGNPVDATTGRKVIPDETDFSLPGLMPIDWSRFYASDLSVDSVLGKGWVLPWEQSLRRSGRFVYLTDNQGRTVPFVDVQPGERVYNPHEQVYLVCTEGGHYLLQTLDNIFFYFGEVPDDNAPVPLQRIENSLGHFLHFTHTVEGKLTDISATGGVRVHLHYDNPLGRLTDVKRIVDNQAVETLVQYRYDDNGQLIEVINRNSDSVRRFSYIDGVMASHSNALGLTCNYRWQTIADQPRVVEHWTSDGEHFHFRYDIDARTTWITDVLGREAEIHYNSDHRVTSSRDFGGEHYVIEIDDTGNMTGLTLPDGNVVIRLIALVNENNAAYQFAYDASDRLVEEKRIDNLTRQFSYNLGGHLTRVDEIGYGERGERPQRHTEFERDPIGRLLAKLNANARQDYTYDDADRLLSIERLPTADGKKLGVSEEKLDFAYDLLGRLIKETTPQGALSYDYDPLSNLTTLTLPTGQHLNHLNHLNHLYYGSGHLHQLNLDGQLISDMERDDLHREVLRTQGKLTSCFGYDAMGRKAWQFASTLPAEKLSQLHNPGIQPQLLVEHAYNPIHRRHQYDPAGELTRTLDKLRGEIKYEYEAKVSCTAVTPASWWTVKSSDTTRRRTG